MDKQLHNSSYVDRKNTMSSSLVGSMVDDYKAIVDNRNLQDAR